MAEPLRNNNSPRRHRWRCVARRGKRVVPSWVPDWSWGLPLLVLTVVAHVSAIFWTAKRLGTCRRTAAKKASHFVTLSRCGARLGGIFGDRSGGLGGSLPMAWRFARLGASDALF